MIRVVVADPDKDVRYALSSHLMVDGRFQVVGEAESSQELLQGCMSRAPDAIIMDYVSMSPVDVLPHLRQSLPEVTIICMSDRNGHLKDQAQQLGADAYIDKSRSMTDDIVSALLAAHPDEEWH